MRIFMFIIFLLAAIANGATGITMMFTGVGQSIGSQIADNICIGILFMVFAIDALIGWRKK
jgi:hypothetical protein